MQARCQTTRLILTFQECTVVIILHLEILIIMLSRKMSSDPTRWWESCTPQHQRRQLYHHPWYSKNSNKFNINMDDHLLQQLYPYQPQRIIITLEMSSLRTWLGNIIFQLQVIIHKKIIVIFVSWLLSLVLSLIRGGKNSSFDVGGQGVPVAGSWPIKSGVDQSSTQKYQKKGKYHWHVVVDGLST